MRCDCYILRASRPTFAGNAKGGAPIVKYPSEILRAGQPPNNLFRRGVGPGGYLLRRLVLNGMRNVNRVKPGASQSAGLYAGRSHEFSGGHGHRGNPQIFKPYRIVQTARCTGPSIGQGFDHRIEASKLLDDRIGRVLCIGRLLCPNNLSHLMALA